MQILIPKGRHGFRAHVPSRLDTASCAAERLSVYIPSYRHQHGSAPDQQESLAAQAADRSDLKMLARLVASVRGPGSLKAELG